MAKDCYMPPYYRYAYRFWLPVLSLLAAMPSIALADCNPWAAKLVSVEGAVELRDSDDAPWTQGVAESLLCPGARVRVGEYGRAAVVLHDNTLLRLDARSTLTMPAGETPGSLLDLLQGTVHFISRVTRGLTVRTPFVNAGVEGTEFLVQVDADSAAVIVFEGKVRAVNAAGEVLLQSGERARASGNQAPVRDIPIKPRDAVQWALYYPPILSFTLELFVTDDEQSWQARVAQSMQLYRDGQLAKAHAALIDLTADISNAHFYTYRASLNLAMGQVTQAQRDIDHALTLTPANADALALKAIIAIVQNDRELGLALAQKAVIANPTATGATLALSYALQANFRLEEARSTLKRAVAVTPNDALLWSRLAELHLMFRELTHTRVAAERATALAPYLSHTQTILGFAQLIAMDVSAARTTFTRAITLDQSAPLPHLGLGLSMIRAGELEPGRRELELAAILNPSEALIRSYLGKAYYEERRGDVAADQYAMAKQLDPLDPTPWFYAAILKQTQNQPIAALEDLQRAIALNNNRAVYRSRLLLDEDAAARSVGLARVYEGLGFRQWALSESRKSLGADPANASAHRFLSDSYSNVPRHEIARVSELLQAQLLQPALITPVSPSAGEAKLLDFEGTGPSTAGFNEFTPLMQSTHTSLLASGMVGSHNAKGGELAAGLFFDHGALSAGRFEQRTGGVRENNDRDVTINDVFAQLQLSPEFSLQGEYRHKDGKYGDTNLLFDPEQFSKTLRRTIEQENFRLGLRYVPAPAHTFVLSVSSGREVDESTIDADFTVTSEVDGEQYEAQYLWQGLGVKTIAGVGLLDSNGLLTTTVDLSAFGFPSPPPTITDQDVKQSNNYIYAHLPLASAVIVLGASYDRVKEENILDHEQYNPKLGVSWQVNSRAQLRGAAFRTLTRQLMQNQTIEPTQIAGFNQFFDDLLGTDAWRYGVGLDYQFSSRLQGGLETSNRDISRLLVLPTSEVLEEKGKEWLHQAYLYWHSTEHVALSAEYLFEGFERDFIPGLEEDLRPAAMTTQRLPMALHYSFNRAVYSRLQVTHVKQELTTVLSPSGMQSQQDTFWITDAVLGYRLPARRGLVELSGRNLADTKFHYQSVNPGPGVGVASPYYPRAAVFLNAQLWF